MLDKATVALRDDFDIEFWLENPNWFCDHMRTSCSSYLTCGKSCSQKPSTKHMNWLYDWLLVSIHKLTSKLLTNCLSLPLSPSGSCEFIIYIKSKERVKAVNQTLSIYEYSEIRLDYINKKIAQEKFVTCLDQDNRKQMDWIHVCGTVLTRHCSSDPSTPLHHEIISQFYSFASFGIPANSIHGVLRYRIAESLRCIIRQWMIHECTFRSLELPSDSA